MPIDASTLTPQEQITAIYVAYYDRAPDPFGLQFWVDQLEGGMSLADIATDFSGAAETIQKYPYFESPELASSDVFITSIYVNLFGRAPDAAGLDFWTDQLELGSTPVGEIILAIFEGAQDSPEGDDLSTVTNKIDVAFDWTEGAANAGIGTQSNPIAADVDGTFVVYDQDAFESATTILDGVTGDAGTVTDAKAASAAFFDGAANAGDTFVLTTGLDNVQGTSANDSIVGIFEDTTSKTFTLGDIIDGKGGVDTLTVVNDSDSNLSFSGKTITSVENLVIQNAAALFDTANLANKAFDSVTIDMGVGEVDLNVNNINAASAVTITNLDIDFADDIDLDFATSSAATAVTDITVSDTDFNELYLDVDANFTAATDYTFNMTARDVDANDNFNVNSNVTLDAADIMLGVNIVLENVTNDEDGEWEFNFDTNGVEMATVNVTMTNAELYDLEIDIDDSNNGTGTMDVANITLTDVDVDDNFEIDHVETINMEINGDVFIDDMEFYDYEGDVTLNIVANGNLVIDGDLNMNDNSFNQTVVISGAGNVDLGELDLVNDANTMQVVDASLATGNITVEDGNSALDEFTGGTGNDSLELGWIGTVADMGAGDDFVDTDGYDYGDANAGTLDGGDGIDTIAIDDGAELDAATAANISNFEILEIGDGTGSYDLSLEASLTGVSVTDDNVNANTSVTGAAAGATLAFAITEGGNATLSDTTFSFALDDATGTDDSLDISFLASDDDDDTTAEEQITAGLTADGIETINIVSDAETLSEESAAGADDALTSADYTNTFTFVGDDAETINISGNAMFDLTLGTATSAPMAVEKIDATANTAGVTVDASTQNAGVGVNTVAVSFDGSDADDVFTATEHGDVVQGNGGADEIVFDSIAANAVGETVRYVAATDSQITFEDGDDDGDADTFSGNDMIDNFVAGEDTIELSSLLGLATGDARSALNQLGTFTVTEDLADVFESFGANFFDDGLTDRAVAFGTDGTDGYVFVDANSDGDFNAADDMVIELTGVTALTVSDFTFG